MELPSVMNGHFFLVLCLSLEIVKLYRSINSSINRAKCTKHYVQSIVSSKEEV